MQLSKEKSKHLRIDFMNDKTFIGNIKGLSDLLGIRLEYQTSSVIKGGNDIILTFSIIKETYSYKDNSKYKNISSFPQSY